jgi:hypothetical protein
MSDEDARAYERRVLQAVRDMLTHHRFTDPSTAPGRLVSDVELEGERPDTQIVMTVVDLDTGGEHQDRWPIWDESREVQEHPDENALILVANFMEP